MEALLTWIKNNVLLFFGILIASIILFFPKLFKEKRRRRRRKLPRSVGMRKRRRTSGPRKQYTKGGKAKKPWQIKGSEAARRHMRKIRKMR